MKSSILLISNSYVNGSGYLAHYAEQIKELLTGIPLLLFVPYAADKSEWDANTQKARVFFNDLGVAVLGVHQLPDDRLLTELKATKAIFIDGGNTFQLLKELQLRNLIPTIRAAVLSGEMQYIGAGAGADIACKAVHTTNDLNVFYPNNGFEGINIFPYYINLESTSREKVESMNKRIIDFHKIHDEPVIGLGDGAYLSMGRDFAHSGEVCLGGEGVATIFIKGKPPKEIPHATRLKMDENGVN